MLDARRFLLPAISTALLGLTFVGSISAQSPGNPMTPSNPSMVGRRLDDDKEALYAQFNDYKRNPKLRCWKKSNTSPTEPSTAVLAPSPSAPARSNKTPRTKSSRS